MIESLVDQIESRFAEVGRLMTDPEVIGDRQRYAEVGREYRRLEPAAKLAEEWRHATDDAAGARELLAEGEDAELREMLRPPRRASRSSRRRSASRWSSPIRTTTRTSSSRSRAAPAARRPGCGPATCTGCSPVTPSGAGFTTEPLDVGDGKYTFAIKGDGAYSIFKFEGGTHRVQRVPATESQGRIHTSTATVAVLPEAEDVDVHIDPNDLKIDVYRSGGPGGQSVNTTDSAVRITHKPSRHLGRRCRTRRASCRTARRRCASCARGSTRPRWPSSRPRPPTPGARRSARATAPRRSGPTTTASGASPTTASSTRRTTSTPCWRASSTSSPPRCRTTRSAAAWSPRPRRSDVRCSPFAGHRRARGAGLGARRAGAAGVRHAAAGRRGAAGHALGVDRATLWRTPTARSAATRRARFRDAIRRRTVERVPVAYLVGRKGFRHLDLQVDPRVLVPRPETEHLVEARAGPAARRARARRRHGQRRDRAGAQGRAADLRVSASDVSPDALAVARANAARLGLDVAFVAGRPARRRRADVDAVVSNPPYVEDGDAHDGARGRAPRARRRPVRRRRRPRHDPRRCSTQAAATRAGRGARGRRRARRRRSARCRGGGLPEVETRRRPRRPRAGGGAGGADDHGPDAGRDVRALHDGRRRRRLPAPTRSTGWPATRAPREAVERLYAIKGRRPDKPAAVMFFSLELALAALPELGPRTTAALEACCPAPVTLLLPNPARRFPLACGRDPDTLGLRVPALGPRTPASAPCVAGAAVRGQPGGRRRRAPVADIPEEIRDARRPRARRRRAAGHASTVVDLRALRGRRRLGASSARAPGAAASRRRSRVCGLEEAGAEIPPGALR